MDIRKLIIAGSIFLVGCGDGPATVLQRMMRNPDNGLVQEKRIGNTVVQCTYLPRCWERVNGGSNATQHPDEMSFRINIQHREKPANGQESSASYGVDSLFQLVLNRDTLQPLMAQRIANGNLGGTLYLVTFERRPLAPVQQAAFIYKDWLFTTTRLVFPLQINFLEQSDSLSCRL